MPKTARSGTITTDHDEIRHWVEERGGTPAAVKRKTRGDAGIIRIDFPGFAGKNLKRISWDEWFKTFDESHLAFLHRDQDRFNKLVRRDIHGGTERGRGRGAGRRTSSARRAERGAAKGDGVKRATPRRAPATRTNRTSTGRAARKTTGTSARTRKTSRTSTRAGKSSRTSGRAGKTTRSSARARSRRNH